MKYMMIVKATRNTEAGVMPSNEMLAAMADFNGQLVDAGVLIDAGGLQPSSKGFRVDFAGTTKSIVDGPFAETKELIAGYWIIDVKSEQEARDWAMKIPNPYDADGYVEVRRFFALEDFVSSEAIESHRRVGEALARP
jgi:hypothetical protein